LDTPDEALVLEADEGAVRPEPPLLLLLLLLLCRDFIACLFWSSVSDVDADSDPKPIASFAVLTALLAASLTVWVILLAASEAAPSVLAANEVGAAEVVAFVGCADAGARLDVGTVADVEGFFSGSSLKGNLRLDACEVCPVAVPPPSILNAGFVSAAFRT
jgi:hypothetical protein